MNRYRFSFQIPSPEYKTTMDKRRFPNHALFPFAIDMLKHRLRQSIVDKELCTRQMVQCGRHQLVDTCYELGRLHKLLPIQPPSRRNLIDQETQRYGRIIRCIHPFFFASRTGMVSSTGMHCRNGGAA